jgi:hypothetical protein
VVLVAISGSAVIGIREQYIYKEKIGSAGLAYFSPPPSFYLGYVELYKIDKAVS